MLKSQRLGFEPSSPVVARLNGTNKMLLIAVIQKQSAEFEPLAQPASEWEDQHRIQSGVYRWPANTSQKPSELGDL